MSHHHSSKPPTGADKGAKQGVDSIPTLNQVVDTGDDSDPGEEFAVELLVQEVVDEFMPAIEAELRQRLLDMDPDALARWLTQYRKRR